MRGHGIWTRACPFCDCMFDVQSVSSELVAFLTRKILAVCVLTRRMDLQLPYFS
jgi:hypothetical protein